MTAAGEQPFVYRGRSMWPTFQDGDVLLMRPAESSGGPAAGDCIVFRLPDHEAPLVHRVLAVHAGGASLRTRGDGHRQDDDLPTPVTAVLGVVVARRRHGRETRVPRGRLGLAWGSLQRLSGRLEPTRASRGGRAGRLLRTLARPLARRTVVPRLQRTEGDDHQPGGLLVLGRCVVGREDGRGVEVVWPWTLVLTSTDLQKGEGGSGPGA